MAKKEAKKESRLELKREVDLKEEQKFNIRNLHTHVSMFFKKFREGKNPKTKFYAKRGR
ncbi:MAG: hypothetical protein Q8N77_00260 [Nanoarchaeota archaeon]|nr:hypothetical protein [Nanoarchaeota archaeon]